MGAVVWNPVSFGGCRVWLVVELRKEGGCRIEAAIKNYFQQFLDFAGI
jgi:hypothetical protein